jgi:hypothetical protein
MAVRCMKNNTGIEEYRLPTELKICESEGGLEDSLANPSVLLAIEALKILDPYSKRLKVILYKG